MSAKRRHAAMSRRQDDVPRTEPVSTDLFFHPQGIPRTPITPIRAQFMDVLFRGVNDFFRPLHVEVIELAKTMFVIEHAGHGVGTGARAIEEIPAKTVVGAYSGTFYPKSEEDEDHLRHSGYVVALKSINLPVHVLGPHEEFGKAKVDLIMDGINHCGQFGSAACFNHTCDENPNCMLVSNNAIIWISDSARVRHAQLESEVPSPPTDADALKVKEMKGLTEWFTCTVWASFVETTRVVAPGELLELNYNGPNPNPHMNTFFKPKSVALSAIARGNESDSDDFVPCQCNDGNCPTGHVMLKNRYGRGKTYVEYVQESWAFVKALERALFVVGSTEVIIPFPKTLVGKPVPAMWNDSAKLIKKYQTNSITTLAITEPANQLTVSGKKCLFGFCDQYDGLMSIYLGKEDASVILDPDVNMAINSHRFSPYLCRHFCRRALMMVVARNIARFPPGEVQRMQALIGTNISPEDWPK